jgi:hypothetical protein
MRGSERRSRRSGPRSAADSGPPLPPQAGVASAAPFTQRRDAHLTLARVLTGVADIDRRTWHRAAACLVLTQDPG